MTDDDLILSIGKIETSPYKGQSHDEMLEGLGSIFKARAHLGCLLLDEP